MSEKNLIVNSLELNYKGIFNFEDLFAFIRTVLQERGYKRHEKEFQEHVKPDGKELFIELRPVKPLTSYFSTMLKIFIKMEKVKDVVLNVDGNPAVFSEGEINMTFDGWNTTDYESRWGSKPWAYFFKSVFNKFVYPIPMDAKLNSIVGDDTRYIYQQVKAHLNLYKYKTDKEQSLK